MHPDRSAQRTILSLLTSTLLFGATIPALAGQVAAAPARQPIVLQASLQGYALQISGSNFLPGDRVSLALIDTGAWQVVHTGSVRAKNATYTCPMGASVMCGQPDPNAGHLSYGASVLRPAGTHFALVYRSSNGFGVQRVRER